MPLSLCISPASPASDLVLFPWDMSLETSCSCYHLPQDLSYWLLRDPNRTQALYCTSTCSSLDPHFSLPVSRLEVMHIGTDFPFLKRLLLLVSHFSWFIFNWVISKLCFWGVCWPWATHSYSPLRLTHPVGWWCSFLCWPTLNEAETDVKAYLTALKSCSGIALKSEGH